MLSTIQTIWLYEFIHRLPIPVTDKAGPASNRPILVAWRIAARNDRSRTLPKKGVSSRPADSLAIDFPIREKQSSAIDGGVVVKHTRRPTFNGSAETLSMGGVTVYKCVRARCSVPHSKIVATKIGFARLKQRLLTASVKRSTPTCRMFRDRCGRGATYYADTIGRFKDRNGRSYESAGRDIPNPNVASFLDADRIPCVIFVFGVLGIRIRNHLQRLDSDPVDTLWPIDAAYGSGSLLGVDRAC